MSNRDQPTIDAANELLRTTMTAAIHLPLADGKSAYLGTEKDIAMMLADKELVGAQFAAKQHLATVKTQAAIIDSLGSAVAGKAELQASSPADSPLTEVVTTIFRRARTSDTEACTFRANSVATPSAAVRGEAVAEPVGWLFGNSFYERGNPRTTYQVRTHGRALYDAPVSASAADAPSEPSDDTMPTERESLIACLDDDAAMLLNTNPGDEMALTMRQAAAMLQRDGERFASSQPTDGGVRNGNG